MSHTHTNTQNAQKLSSLRWFSIHSEGTHTEVGIKLFWLEFIMLFVSLMISNLQIT